MKIPRNYLVIAIIVAGLVLVAVALVKIISNGSITGEVVSNPEDNGTLTNSANESLNNQDNGTNDEINETDLLADDFFVSSGSGGGSSPSGSSGGSGGSGNSQDDEESLDWEEGYSYGDNYSEGGIVFIDDSKKEIEVSRAYFWRSEFGKMFTGKIKVVQSNDNFSWYGSRLAVVDSENPMIRYEVRLLPNENKLEVRYVDRTDRNDSAGTNDSLVNEDTISEFLDSDECEINIGEWYLVNIMKNDETWKAQLIKGNSPTCFVEWEDDRINDEKLVVGIQSAGKYVVSRFDEIIAI